MPVSKRFYDYRAVFLLVSALMSGHFDADAQQSRGGVARSGMEQGEAVVAVRSDISLAIRGTGGTTKINLAALGEAVRSKIPDLKACYTDVIEKSPIVVGKLQIVIDFSGKAKHPELKFPNGQNVAPALESCIQKTLGKASLNPKNRPAAAVIILDFTNTRARGQRMLNTKKRQGEEQTLVGVKTNSAGLLESKWSTSDGKVAFIVTAETSVPKEQIASVQGVLKNYVGRFLDCRRRCSKGETSPAGDATLDLRVRRSGEASMKIRSITIAHKRAPKCLERTFRKIEFERPTAPVRLTVIVRFAD
jgi:hypothetical protein